MDLYAAKIAHPLTFSHQHLPVHLQLQNIAVERVACVKGQLPWCSKIDLWLAGCKIEIVLGHYLSLCCLESYLWL